MALPQGQDCSPKQSGAAGALLSVLAGRQAGRQAAFQEHQHSDIVPYALDCHSF